ncbi:MAG TPA: NAD(P)-dependent oxidoreductase [Aliidongia sp.]|nr:NAD(P)-dependent oxidoreductase [Aliidongia sp.]
MKIFLHKRAADRIGEALGATGLPLELLTVDDDGAFALDGKPIEVEAVRPDIVWLSLDAFATKQSKLFLDKAAESGAVRMMQSCVAGLDLPVFRRIFEQGTKLANSDAQAIAIAEYVVANVVAEWHPIAEQRKAQSERQWRRVPFRELSQSRWLIVGFGKIGQEIARRVKPFGAHVTGIRRNMAPHAAADEMAALSDLRRFLPAADVVVLAAGLNDATRDLAGADFFTAMKPGAFFVNIGRGDLVDEAALLGALDHGTPSVAILDVFRTEPLPPDSPFWAHPRIRLTPHSASGGDGTRGRGDSLFLTNLKRFAAGERLVNEVDERSF